MPFGYCIEAFSLKLFGVTAFCGTPASVIFSIGTCLVLAWLSKDLKLRFPFSSVFVLALSPIYVRYSLEARPYAQGIFFTTCATLLWVRFSRDPTLLRLVLFFSASLRSIYTQPYSFLPIGAQVLIISFEASWRARLQLLAATGFAVVAFIPWLFFAKDIWASGIQATVASSGISIRSIFLIAKDLLGLGYLGSCVVVGLCACALWSASVPRNLKLFLLASILVPIAGVVILDSLAGYFLAIHQMIFVLPAIAMLAALGFQALTNKGWAKLGSSLLAALLVFSLSASLAGFANCGRIGMLLLEF